MKRTGARRSHRSTRSPAFAGQSIQLTASAILRGPLYVAGTICLKKRAEAALYCLHTDLSVEKKFGPATELQSASCGARKCSHHVLHRHALEEDPRFRLRQRHQRHRRRARPFGYQRRCFLDPDGMAVDGEGRPAVDTPSATAARSRASNPTTQQVEQQDRFPVHRADRLRLRWRGPRRPST